ncbi:MAG: NAD-dependent succinate-semialdehyde dehydrogenase [Ignavibacteriales bacterium]|jgi:succinate-semialdehyde dehydrogenase/glutarate-semialdehyde dehydrogenase|nr:MAG: NAD-dependent succinate-semialdehyde dehydrogenase [Ignavibacterium sp.]MCZ2268894.1 NAD-dependent succinate-semialdehyde dehydrogenase [Ignavibacteriales bacterium]MDX9712276.1 NAD-dependent succinate-semialdehyde dehydrogenase [Ignavibacteriaceae bacterium]GIK22336.1 MAG: succinate-semialdehyde dehydrogenase [Ignavibacteriota bacterium]
MLTSINPSNNKVLKQYDEMTTEQSSKIISLAHQTFLKWKETSFTHRAGLMKKAAEILRQNSEEYSVLMTMEMGKPLAQSRAEVEKCAWVCDYYSENAEKFLADEIIKTEASKSFVTYQPLGVILAVMPWNFPFWQVFRFAAPNLMAGNAGVLKHASNVSGCALAIEDIFRKAGFPENLFRTLLVSSKNVKPIIENENIKAVTLTGSVPAGKSVASLAGSRIKKTVLELGGSDPYIVLEDADLEKAALSCVNSRLINAGQSCIAAKRFIIVEKVYDEFEKYYLKFMSEKKMGDPSDEKNHLGPQASIKLRDELHNQVLRSVELGAEIILGGKIPSIDGAYYPPTILKNVKPGMPAFDEELFGPVAALIKAKDEDEAIELANNSIFGLGAAVFTKDNRRGELIAKERLNAGCCFVNDFVKSDPRLPFGGIKESGYGRELSPFGIKEFVNIKTVFIK